MDALNVVLPRSGYFWVGTLTDEGLEALKVTDRLRCACGGSDDAPCEHIQAVRCYQRLEGNAARCRKPRGGRPGRDARRSARSAAAPVTGTAERWRCIALAGALLAVARRAAPASRPSSPSPIRPSRAPSTRCRCRSARRSWPRCIAACTPTATRRTAEED